MYIGSPPCMRSTVPIHIPHACSADCYDDVPNCYTSNVHASTPVDPEATFCPPAGPEGAGVDLEEPPSTARCSLRFVMFSLRFPIALSI